MENSILKTRNTSKGDIITISETSTMFCLGRESKAIVVYVYEDDNSAFVIDRSGQVRGLVFACDYHYNHGDNEKILNKINLEVSKNTNNHCDFLVGKGDIIEIHEPSFCLLFGERKKFQVLHICKNGIPYILLPSGEVTSVLKNFKVISSSEKIFTKYWNKRNNRLLEIDERIIRANERG